jgi:hypothetical protein
MGKSTACFIYETSTDSVETVHCGGFILNLPGGKFNEMFHYGVYIYLIMRK